MLDCKICGAVLRNAKSYVEHCKVHTNLPRLRLPCCYPDCSKSVASYPALKLHIFRDHSKRQQINVQHDATNLHCSIPLCKIISTSKMDFIRHLRLHIGEGRTVECPVRFCSRKYKVCSSFSCHLSRDHLNWTTSDLKSVVNSKTAIYGCSSAAPIDQGCEKFDAVMYNENNAEDENECHLSLAVSQDTFTQNLALFFARMSVTHLIPDRTIDIIANELLNVSSINHMLLKQYLEQTLVTADVPLVTISRCLKAVDDGDLLNECLDTGGQLHSQQRRNTYIRQNLPYVQPVAIYLGMDSTNKKRYCHYVPIKDTLLSLLQDPSVLAQCLVVPHSEPGVLQDFIDGSVYQQVASDPGKHYLSLILYQDSFEVVNPLGSAKKKHKVLGVYFVLGNLSCHNRAMIDHTQLVLLVLESDFNRVGQCIFEQLVSDLRSLEADGISAGGYNFHLVIPAIAGDNLGSHCIGGFKMNLSTTGQVCRFCTLTKSEMDAGQMHCSVDQLRTPQSYDHAVLQVTDTETAVDGIKFASIFNQLSTFHVSNPGLPPCIAHDLLEGVIVYDVPLILRYFVKTRKWLTVSYLNNKIERFHLYGPDARVRPALVNSSLERLTGSASQNWCFLRILPLLIADKVEWNDAVYQALQLLRLCVEFVMAPALSYGQVAYMKVLIDDYIERRQTLFPETRLRPKHHYLTHYASLTMKFGPLIRLWTLRFENKHQYFKRCVRNSHNFINVTSMLANRHQMLQAYLSARPRLSSHHVTVEGNAITDLSQFEDDIRKMAHQYSTSGMQVYSQVNIKGTTYSKGFVLPLHVQHEMRKIEFGEIQLVLVDIDVQFIVRLWSGHFDFALGCYVIEKTNDIKCMSFKCFVDYHPLSIYKFNSSDIVVLRHAMLDSNNE
jgi:hypothetical protein